MIRGYKFRLHNRRVQVGRGLDENNQECWCLKFIRFDKKPNLRKRECKTITHIHLSDEAFMATIYLYELITNEKNI